MATSYQFRENGRHYTGAGFFAYGYSAIGEPRVKMIRRWYKGGRTEDRYFVDGALCEAGDIADRLKSPPILTHDEIAALRKFTAGTNIPPGVSYEVAHALQEKGMVRAEKGLWTRVEPEPDFRRPPAQP